jgi:uncharacterized protein (TIGR03435 family)
MGRGLLLVLLPALLAQTPQPTFEVADIKPSDPSNPTPRSKGRVLPGGRIELPGATLKELIMFAYGVQEDMISGGPGWATRGRYDIVAKGPENPSPEVVRPMLQALLAESFKLTIHRVEKVQSAFVLTLGKRPPRYIEGDGGRQQCAWSVLESGLNRRECHNLSMAEFARQLPGAGKLGIDLPVIDQTGLKGVYDFHFDVGNLFQGGVGERGGLERPPAGPPAGSGPTIFGALEQIGLKLERRKMPLQAIVIDHAEQP